MGVCCRLCSVVSSGVVFSGHLRSPGQPLFKTEARNAQKLQGYLYMSVFVCVSYCLSVFFYYFFFAEDIVYVMKVVIQILPNHDGDVARSSHKKILYY